MGQLKTISKLIPHFIILAHYYDTSQMELLLPAAQLQSEVTTAYVRMGDIS